jgi:hypothetical protein
MHRFDWCVRVSVFTPKRVNVAEHPSMNPLDRPPENWFHMHEGDFLGPHPSAPARDGSTTGTHPSISTSTSSSIPQDWHTTVHRHQQVGPSHYPGGKSSTCVDFMTITETWSTVLPAPTYPEQTIEQRTFQPVHSYEEGFTAGPLFQPISEPISSSISQSQVQDWKTMLHRHQQVGPSHYPGGRSSTGVDFMTLLANH